MQSVYEEDLQLRKISCYIKENRQKVYKCIFFKKITPFCRRSRQNDLLKKDRWDIFDRRFFAKSYHRFFLSAKPTKIRFHRIQLDIRLRRIQLSRQKRAFVLFVGEADKLCLLKQTKNKLFIQKLDSAKPNDRSKIFF